ncbi:unnamed protein product [Dibothriocephalus latus]|uniref:Uncharacterized protein n=1 Tax=Dibothriocephalus latus TaxID=60516 RepID=A0A3P7RBV0_DIBLA|nr:unnamed protein product [Dibothriocephalus latus]
MVQKLNELSSLQQERAVAAAATSATVGQFAVPQPPSSSASSLSGVASPSTEMLKSATSDAGVSPQWANLMMEQRGADIIPVPGNYYYFLRPFLLLTVLVSVMLNFVPKCSAILSSQALSSGSFGLSRNKSGPFVRVRLTLENP